MKQFISILLIIVSLLNGCNNKSKQQVESKDSTITNEIKTKNMDINNFTTTILVDKTPEETFNAINNVRGWWSKAIDGSTAKLNAEFNYHFKDVHICKIKIIEFVPGQKVVWLVLENYFNFTKDKTQEWKGTKISFEIAKKEGKTQLVFTHIGLVPEYECYKICAGAWGNYIGGSLKNLIETGKGNANPYEPAIKSAEALEKENKQ